MPRIHQQHCEVTFEQIKNRLPEDTGRFHCHMGHTFGFEPFDHLQQIVRHRSKLPNLHLHASVRLGSPHGTPTVCL